MRHILLYKGENGLRGFWQGYENQIEEVEVDDIGCTLDADYPEDTEKLKRYLAARK